MTHQLLFTDNCIFIEICLCQKIRSKYLRKPTHDCSNKTSYMIEYGSLKDRIPMDMVIISLLVRNDMDIHFPRGQLLFYCKL